jgi:hypothetical protein
LLTLDAKLLASPADREPIAKALRKLAVEFEQEIEERTYLPPPTRQLPAVPDQSSFRPIRQLIREISGGSSGGDGANAYISALSRRSRRIANLMSTLRRSRQPIILLGDPGSGKSLTLQQVAIAFARQQEKRVYPSLCIFLRLGRWGPVRAPAEPDAEAVRDLVRSACPSDLVSGLDELDRQGRLLVIFDGMDEMSRSRYVEHTTALHMYAGLVEGRVRTLFSCRIADFAPTFHHRRLVLLPFDRRHVRTYLDRQFLGERIEVDGQLLTAQQLSARLVSDELVVRATNPYVLYLLSLYIQNNKTIPTRRTELLDYYFAFAIERKEAELEGRCLPTERFDLWAPLALAITKANAGSEIRRTELDLLLGPDAETAVRAGQVTGVLLESVDRDPEAPALIRFESHRAQEYFAAYAIATSSEPFDWSARLDVPRWQETLVNVAQMGKAGTAIAELARTLRAVPALWERSADPVERIWIEIEAAERADLAGRVLRELPPAPEREELRELVMKAALWLIQGGTGISKAGVLRTVQQAPEIGGPDLIAPALRDESGWVRDQAYLVQSRLTGPNGPLSVLEEVALAYAQGELLGRLPRYLKLAHRLKRPALALGAAAGAGLQVLSLALSAAVGPALLLAALHLGLAMQVAPEVPLFLKALQDDPEKVPPIFSALQTLFTALQDHKAFLVEHEDGIRLVLVVLAGALAVFVARLDMRHATTWLSAAGIGFVYVPAVLELMWAGAPEANLGSLIAGLAGVPGFAILAFPAGGFLSLIIWASCTLAFAAVISLAAGSSRAAGRMFSAAWEASGLWIAALALLAFVLLAVFLVGYIASLFLLEPWVEAVANRIGLSPTWFPPKTLTGQVLTLLMWLTYVLFFPLLSPFLRGERFDFARDLHRDVRGWRFISLGIAWLVVGPFVVQSFIAVLDRIKAGLAYAVYALMLLLALALLGALTYVTYFVLSPVLDQMRRLAALPDRIDIAQWSADMRASSPERQARLLKQADPARFGMNLEQTIEALASVQSKIREEPARSAYDAKMHELTEILRQRRSG